YYIPYRAQTTTDPTVAFYTVLQFYPKYTYKLEVVVVAADDSLFPDMADVRVLPGIDGVENDPEEDGKREAWYDTAYERTNDGSGSDIQFYSAYIWTQAEDRNEIKRGEILLQSDQLMLIASQDLYPSEQRVYRYGYNMSTGEIFIPTSSNFVYDASTLAAVNGDTGNYY
ncbi:MAG: hypothetical protein LUD68_00235, partial [Rikenellaceae bacterium]|nr:hypothetical protein [Rikenellaceae bacterium]